MQPVSFFRRAAFASAAFCCALVPTVGNGIASKALIGAAVATATVAIPLEAEAARQRVQDHRRAPHHSPPRRPPPSR